MTESILDLLKEERVLVIYYGLQDEDKFTMFEGCDRFFGVDLTAEQMRQLGQEIIDLADRHEP